MELHYERKEFTRTTNYHLQRYNPPSSHININIDISQFSLMNVFFLDTKRNIIMDGNFTKIIYSNQYFSMNSIFLFFPIEILSVDTILNKRFIKYNPSHSKNQGLIEYVSKIESRILDYFKAYSNINVRNSTLLSKQLNSGSVKIYHEHDDHSYESTSCKSRDFSRENPIDDVLASTFTIKISGIWENYQEIGLTYKILEHR